MNRCCSGRALERLSLNLLATTGQLGVNQASENRPDQHAQGHVVEGYEEGRFVQATPTHSVIPYASLHGEYIHQLFAYGMHGI